MTHTQPNLRIQSTRAREVLASVTAVLSHLERQDGDVRPDGGPGPLGAMSGQQDDMLRLVSITGAIRSNVDLVPQSLRQFLG